MILFLILSDYSQCLPTGLCNGTGTYAGWTCTILYGNETTTSASTTTTTSTSAISISSTTASKNYHQNKYFLKFQKNFKFIRLFHFQK